MERAWEFFTARSCPHQSEDIAMAVWASLYRDGQAMEYENQVSPSVLVQILLFSLLTTELWCYPLNTHVALP